ncbi:MAG TPA: M1 family peptidase [Crocinitomix sp.]|nr:M1 family peptidase [Crocinitomix sp.]
MRIIVSVSFMIVMLISHSQNTNKFKQLKEELATPNVYRTASGAPGHKYYQQKANYSIKLELEDDTQIIRGEETVTYFNNSPDYLEYLWVQLDQNMRAQDSDTKLTSTSTIENFSYTGAIERYYNQQEFDGGFKIEYVKDASNKDLPYTIVKTMMRIDLEKPLAPGQNFIFKTKWWYNINDRIKIGGRSGLEYFEEEDNYIYTIAQFYPRMCVYNDVEGWQNKQFLGSGEFTLTFGDFDVQITVPSDHIVAATGVLQNANKVLTATQRKRLEKAKSSDLPVYIVTPDEAKENEQNKSTGKKTWHFKAKNVRDFAFASSRKFIWDAQVVKQKTKDVMAMSFYPKEGMPLWNKYSTRLVAQTLKTYSKHTFDYPYPVAISVHTKWIGMEYPMICFNGGRPDPDGTYTERTKYGMHSVIIHEVGHNYFPMIVNSDERQWTWMDEGLNTYLQYLTEQEWQRDYPSRRGPAHLIVDYMKGDNSTMVPIMTNSESLLQFGNNAYGKPATALNILRETVVGRELFDYAFKVYANRWMFKHPTPADFFRTIEDASGIDLDWFWRGWFMTTDHVDIALDRVKWYKVNSNNPEKQEEYNKELEAYKNENISTIRNRKEIKETTNEKHPELNDQYVGIEKNEATAEQLKEYNSFLQNLSDKDKEFLEKGYNFYQLDFKNIGGLVMPIILEFTFIDNTKKIIRIPAEIWRKNNDEVSKVFIFEKEVKSIQLDPFLETADTDESNNAWPTKQIPSRFNAFTNKKSYYH